jgi:putative oxygen-independent coproporphyrinogen III oxidase
MVGVSMQAPPLSLYVHMPWCVRKCPYCDFNSHTAPDELPEQRYIHALLQDLEFDARTLRDRTITSVFFGGGTPSLFSSEAIAEFLASAKQILPFTADVEVTLEANPGTVEHGSFERYRKAGVNRISLGAQSFNPDHLKALGRIHDVANIERAVSELASAGIDNFNLDLMYGLPEQSVEQALADVSAAIALQPTHISHYQLTLEPGTVFYHRPPPLPDGEIIWDMQVQTQAMLANAGYRQYEVSAYAQARARCQHNLNYWQYGDYIGVGAGAHGKLTKTDTGGVRRTIRLKQPREYLSTPVVDRVTQQMIVEPNELAFEFLLNALRLADGFDMQTFESRTGLHRSTIESGLSEAGRRGLLARDDADGWKPTPLGARFLNDLQLLFLPDRADADVRQGAGFL